MQKVEPGYNILSVFTPIRDSVYGESSEYKKTSMHGLALAVVGAFFIVAMAAAILQFALSSRTEAQASNFEEAIAYHPSQTVTAELTQGYLGR